MNLKRAFKPLVIGMALAILALAAGNQGGIGAAQAQEEPPCTVTIQPGESIQTAINRAKDGDILCLSEGIWKENIKISKPLTLRGAGEEKTIIKGAKNGPVVWITSNEEILVKIGGMTITNAKKGDCKYGHTAPCGNGIVIHDKVKAVITDSIIQKNNDDGILLDFIEFPVTISNCIINKNGDVGVYLDYSSANISDSTISENFWGGIQVYDESQLTLSGSRISKNQHDGIYLTGTLLLDSPQATISNSTISGNGDDGIELMCSSKASITNSTISENRGDGIILQDPSKAKIDNNNIHDNGSYGIFASPKNLISCTGNNVYGNGTGYSGGDYGGGAEQVCR